MKYVIYQIFNISSLSTRSPYNWRDTFYPNTLVQLNVEGVITEHATMESAVKEIETHREKLASRKLTVLPVFNIDRKGEIDKLIRT